MRCSSSCGSRVTFYFPAQQERSQHKRRELNATLKRNQHKSSHSSAHFPCWNQSGSRRHVVHFSNCANENNEPTNERVGVCEVSVLTGDILSQSSPPLPHLSRASLFAVWIVEFPVKVVVYVSPWLVALAVQLVVRPKHVDGFYLGVDAMFVCTEFFSGAMSR